MLRHVLSLNYDLSKCAVTVTCCWRLSALTWPSHDLVSLTAHSQTSINRRHTCSKHSANIQTLAHVSEWLTLVPNSESSMLKFSGFIFKLQNGPVTDNILQNLSSQTGFYTFSSYVQTFVKQRNHSYVSFFFYHDVRRKYVIRSDGGKRWIWL